MDMMKLALRDFAEIVETMRGPAVANGGAEHRRAARMTITYKVIAIVEEAGKPMQTYTALTRDISLTGLGLLQTIKLIPPQEVIVALPRNTKPLFVVATALHCRPLADGLLAVGLEFARMLDEKSAARIIESTKSKGAPAVVPVPAPSPASPAAVVAN
jgi:hypothetical protein